MFIVPIVYCYLTQDGRFDALCCIKSRNAYEYSTYKEFLYTFFNKYFTSGLLSTFVRPIVVRHLSVEYIILSSYLKLVL